MHSSSLLLSLFPYLNYLLTIPFSLFLSLLSFPSTTTFLFPFLLFSPPPATALSLTYPSISLLTSIATNAFSPTSSLILFFFFTTTEGFLPTSIINLGACCLLALSIEALFSTYCIFRERNVTAFLVMKLLPFDIIRLRKHSVGCLGDICKYYNNGTIGELPRCFFVFSQSRSEPNLGDFCVFSGERNLFFTLVKR